jgi:hypothetical protein
MQYSASCLQPTRRNTILTFCSCLFSIVLGIVLLEQGMHSIQIYDIKSLYEFGFGAVNSNSLVGVRPPGLLATILFANLPQGILSFLYLTYNGLFTCVLGAYEWSLFARSRKPLRVTAPIGKQRSTYYLQLPYIYAIVSLTLCPLQLRRANKIQPLLIISGSLHWLMSQSLFLALVDVFNDIGYPSEGESISAVGYSCIAILFAIIVGSVAVLGGILNGFRRYPSGIPLVGSCSAAISAACHQPGDDSSASQLLLKWGAMDADTNAEIGHCCLSSFEVTDPVKGSLYAGYDMKQD